MRIATRCLILHFVYMWNNWILSLNGRRTHRIATGSLFFLSGLCGSSWASRIPTIQQNLKLSDGAMGGVLMAAPVGLVLSLPISGWVIQKKGSRIVSAVSAIAYAVVLLLLGLSPTIPFLITSLFLFGFSGNLLNIAMNTQAVEVEGLYGRSIMASFHGLWSLAGFSGALIGNGMMGLSIAPFGHFLSIALLVIGVTLLSYPNLMRTTPEETGEIRKPFFVKPDRSLVLLGFIALFVMVCEGAMAD